MAYMSQETKKKLAPQIKAVLKKYGMKGTLSVRHHSTLVINIKEGKLDVFNSFSDRGKPDYDLSGSLDVNPYWIKEHYEGKVKDFLVELKDAMMKGNHDKSDIMTDYFDVGWYIDINIGRWNKPYKLIA